MCSLIRGTKLKRDGAEVLRSELWESEKAQEENLLDEKKLMRNTKRQCMCLREKRISAVRSCAPVIPYIQTAGYYRARGEKTVANPPGPFTSFTMSQYTAPVYM